MTFKLNIGIIIFDSPIWESCNLVLLFCGTLTTKQMMIVRVVVCCLNLRSSALVVAHRPEFCPSKEDSRCSGERRRSMRRIDSLVSLGWGFILFHHLYVEKVYFALPNWGRYTLIALGIAIPLVLFFVEKGPCYVLSCAIGVPTFLWGMWVDPSIPLSEYVPLKFTWYVGTILIGSWILLGFKKSKKN